MNYNTSDLGPWNRFEDLHEAVHPESTHQQRQQNDTQKQIRKMKETRKQNLQIFLPRVTVRKQEFASTIQHQNFKSKSIKNKDTLIKQPIKMNQVNMKLTQKQIKKQYSIEIQGRKSRTLSFDPPLISFYNKKHPRVKNQRTLFSFINIQMELEEHFKLMNSNPKVNKIDLSTQYISQEEEGKQPKELSAQLERRNNHQFSRKRSLLQMIKSMRNSSDEKMCLTERRRENDRNGRYNSIDRSNTHRQGSYQFINMSMQAEPRYIPYFQARKSHYSMKRK